MEKGQKQWIYVGVIAAIILILLYYFVLRKKKKESGFAIAGATAGSGCKCGTRPCTRKGEASTCCEPCKAKESSFHGHGHGGGHFFHGGRGRWGGGWGGYPWGWGYPYYDDEPIVIGSTKCPKGWIWMGAMLGCVKPQ